VAVDNAIARETVNVRQPLAVVTIAVVNAVAIAAMSPAPPNPAGRKRDAEVNAPNNENLVVRDAVKAEVKDAARDVVETAAAESEAVEIGAETETLIAAETEAAIVAVAETVDVARETAAAKSLNLKQPAKPAWPLSPPAEELVASPAQQQINTRIHQSFTPAWKGRIQPCPAFSKLCRCYYSSSCFRN